MSAHGGSLYIDIYSSSGGETARLEPLFVSVAAIDNPFVDIGIPPRPCAGLGKKKGEFFRAGSRDVYTAFYNSGIQAVPPATMPNRFIDILLLLLRSLWEYPLRASTATSRRGFYNRALSP